ncbi:MAG: Chaperone protein DnaJ [Candidatus Scalindua rubra]|uniref:Chaperone protein DnaJ n=1 Tax=Candidatus Scalindua rubra TaxID=1872076 RepID=A0A1E3XD42_9BACT|nr:MAG: Chaperone protein DnaJ [Candidatus Scalindua rubra]
MVFVRPKPMIKKAVRTKPVTKGESVIATGKLEVPAWKKSLEAGIRAGRRKPLRTLSVKAKKTLQEIGKEYAKDRARVSCAFCKGTGIDPYGLSPLSKCVVCSGRGYVFVQKPYEKCKACVGTGRYIGTHMYCWTCKGRGVVPASQGK